MITTCKPECADNCIPPYLFLSLSPLLPSCSTSPSYDDVIVGAPMYSVIELSSLKVEVGRAYVFMNNGTVSAPFIPPSLLHSLLLQPPFLLHFLPPSPSLPLRPSFLPPSLFPSYLSFPPFFLTLFLPPFPPLFLPSLPLLYPHSLPSLVVQSITGKPLFRSYNTDWKSRERSVWHECTQYWRY